MTKKHIEIDAKHRLSLDADNIQIEVLTAIDPTKSPQYDPEKHSAEMRYEWQSIGKYYSSLPKALTGLLEYSIRTGDATTLGEIRYDIAEFRRHVDGLLDGEVAK